MHDGPIWVTRDAATEPVTWPIFPEHPCLIRFLHKWRRETHLDHFNTKKNNSLLCFRSQRYKKAFPRVVSPVQLFWTLKVQPRQPKLQPC